MAKRKRVPFRRSTDRRVVAGIEDGVLLKRVRASAHFFEDIGCWAFDAIEFQNKRQLFHTIEVTAKDRGLVYTISTFDFMRHMRDLHEGGEGRQYVCELRFWSVRQVPHQPELEPPVKS